MTEVIAVALAESTLKALTAEGELACTGVSLRGGDKGVYTLHLNFGVNVADVRREPANEQVTYTTLFPGDWSPRPLRYVRWAKPCLVCGAEVQRGTSAKWVPALKSKGLACEHHADDAIAACAERVRPAVAA